jgi:ABC-type transport system involved in multi-copper enzyme maturation permease subunit
MLNFYSIWRIALYEAKLLLRSWGFRIFSALGLVILTFLTIAIGTTAIYSPYFFHSLSSSLPLNSIKLFNVYQGLIAAFLATEFFKRDKKHNTNQVVLASSFSNMEYFLGKVVGILSVFALLNAAVLLITFVIHFFFSGTIFAWQPYILYTLLISLPMLIFMIGLSFLLSTLLRSQAVAFVLMLAYSLLVLVIIGPHMFNLFDSYAFYQPLIYSDFIGLGNIQPLLLIRGAYLLLGLSFIAATVLLTRRLRQSVSHNIGAGIFLVVCLLLAVVFGHSFINGKLAEREYRNLLKASSSAVSDIPTATMTNCDINLQHKGDEIEATAKLLLVNDSMAPLDSILLTLNPGLTVNAVSGDSGQFNFKRENHLLWIMPSSPVKPEDSISLSISYSGSIDERYCFLDIDEDRLESPYRLWIYNIPKRYALVTSNYLHLTSESGWYPISGLSQGAAFPSTAKQEFTKYSLSTTVPEGMIALSQSEPHIETSGKQLKYTFKPESPLSKISLTIGQYERHQIEINNVAFALYILPGHAYFTPYLNEIADALPKLIQETIDEYEVLLGLEYPHQQLSLVEVPIQFFSYQRFWTVAQEMVQPQLVFLPEMGTICASSDFRSFGRRMNRFRGRMNMNISPAEIQSSYFNRFVRANLTGTQANFRGMIRTARFRISTQLDVEPQFEIFPNFVSYTTHLSSSKWPVLNYALESYLRDRVSSSSGQGMRRYGGGLSNEEQVNLALKDRSLSDMIDSHSEEASILNGALQAKGRYLLLLLEAKLGAQDFENKITEFLNSRRLHTISEGEFIDFLSTLGDVDFHGIIDSWYNDAQIPGYLVEDIETYQVVDGEHTRTQVKFQISNPTSVDGMLEVSFRFRGGGRGGDRMGMGMRGQSQDDYSRSFLMPAKTTKDVGIVIDQPPAMMTIDTYVSQNIPSVITVPFRSVKLKPDVKPFEVERSRPFEKAEPGTDGEYIVDNEDAGFEVLNEAKENWLRRTLRSLFVEADGNASYMGMNTYTPPSNWMPAAYQNFYGKLIRSGFLKRSGDGQDKVAWNVKLSESGNYDIYFYHEGSRRMRMGRMRSSQRNQKSRDRSYGKKHFLIYYEDGVEELVVDLKDAEDGWNLLGTFPLLSGKNRIELTDKNDVRYVTADAVKWVRK